MIEPYKDRIVDEWTRVEVYRNLNRRDGVWYSVRQGGRVVGHTRDIKLRKCHFMVNEAGRQRVLRTGTKNVHAWVCGYYVNKARERDDHKYMVGDPKRARYNPRGGATFEYELEVSRWEPISIAMAARLNDVGLTVWGVRV